MSKVDKNELKIIFQGIKAGDEKSIEMLYKKYYSVVYGIAFSILKNKENSEDITQNVFTKILKMDKELLPSQGEASWLYIVTKNEVMQFLRSQKVTVDIDDMYTIESENSEIDDFVDMTSYHKLLEKLSPVDREIVSLRIISDFTFEKIAQMLDMPLGTVQWKYYKALHHVKLSITNLASYLIVLSILHVIKTENRVFNNETISDEEYSSEPSDSGTHTKPSTGTYDYGDISFDDISSTSITESASDSTGTARTSRTVINTLITLSMILVTVIFVVVMIYFLFSKKIKVKKRDKKEEIINE